MNIVDFPSSELEKWHHLSGRSSSGLVVSSPSLLNPDNTSAAWLLIAALCTPSSLNSNRQSHQRVNWPVASTTSRTDLHRDPFGRWIYDLPNFGVNNSPSYSQTFYMCYIVVLLEAPSASWSSSWVPFFALFDFSCIKRQPICLSLVSTSKVECAVVRAKASTGADTNLWCIVANALGSSWVRVSDVLDLFFLNFLMSKAAGQTELRTDYRYT